MKYKYYNEKTNETETLEVGCVVFLDEIQEVYVLDRHNNFVTERIPNHIIEDMTLKLYREPVKSKSNYDY